MRRFTAKEKIAMALVLFMLLTGWVVKHYRVVSNEDAAAPSLR